MCICVFVMEQDDYPGSHQPYQFLLTQIGFIYYDRFYEARYMDGGV